MTPRRPLFEKKPRSPWEGVLAGIAIVALLYLFLFSLKLMESSFHSFGKANVKDWLAVAENPFVGLMLGILVTSIVQSSSFTTASVVTMVASGSLELRWAIPIIMGANIGTTVTNTLVSMGHITRREDFKRAFSAATVHDVFNILTVALLFPIEITFHYLERCAGALAGVFVNVRAPEQHNLLKKSVAPLVKLVHRTLIDPLRETHEILASVVCLLIAVAFLFLALYLFTRLLRALLFGRVETILDSFAFKTGLRAMLLGFIITAIVQSSSVTTSIIVPLAGAGLLTIEQLFPFTLGANVGTTMTALVGSLVAGANPVLHAAGVTVALAHLLFNVTGILVFYPIPQFRRLPLTVARTLGAAVAKRRYLAPLIVLIIFFVIPLICIGLWKLVT